ncbi:MAG TPA: ABC-F family ATP-binding cassette domain-containing protein, partial [Thermodesulfovibrionia bacterium]|nr:ABC-F family ATP-binding cassette domain-containing protein [Thermodesulfovibrionia bacterium]
MIQVDKLTKRYGNRVLFENVSFMVNARERVGLVGRNGHGKTTLLRILTGEEGYDDGTLSMPRNYRIGYLRQNLNFTEDTVLKEGVKGLQEQEQGHSWKVEKILAGLGFTQETFAMHPLEISGGYQVRLNLAKVLVSDPDLLLLDEPTNYLDITSIRWLERFLTNWPRELILITHDRGFMDKVITHTIGIHLRKVRKVQGNTEKYYMQIAQEAEIYEKTRINDEKRRKDIEIFIRRFRAKARLANMVQSRIKTLAKTEKREKLEKIKDLSFSFRYSPFASKYVMQVDNLSFGYDSPLIQDLSFAVGAHDRICVIGKNGKGKTTLLKLLAGVLASQKGRVNYSSGVVNGFFEQTNIKTLVDSNTVEEEILNACPEMGRKAARDICGAMMFEGDEALKTIRMLSGGEKSRVMLGKILAQPVNLLLLDEATNHLDMESCDSLLAAIDNFEGAVIMVTHNEMFLHALAERLIVFQRGRVSMFEGSYQRFLEKEGWEDEEEVRVKNNVKNEDSQKFQKKDMRKLRSEIIIERSRVVKSLEQSVAEVEDAIESHERRLTELNTALEKASQASERARIVEISMSMHHAQLEIDRLFGELERVT